MPMKIFGKGEHALNSRDMLSSFHEVGMWQGHEVHQQAVQIGGKHRGKDAKFEEEAGPYPIWEDEEGAGFC